MPQSDGLPEGALFAGFRIIRRLGAGGMGEVYLAQHPRLPRRDALKILPGELTDNLEFRQRFNREADLAANLYNEHIVGIHDRGEYEGQLWISMDYVEGTDAAQLLRQYPSGLPKADVVEIIAAVADALDYAHSRGLLHRDVKPANILISDAAPRRRIVLADFGIARELGEISGLTATNMMMGTTAYCAPEQLQGLDIDGRADQYALGCTAFNLLTGAAPFQNSNPAVVITQHLSAPPPPVSQRRPELADLDGALTKALAKNPADRFATCSDFAAALGSQLGAAADIVGPTRATPIADTEVIPTSQTASPATSPARSTRRTAVAVAAVVGLALVGLGVLVGVRVLGGSHQSGNGNAKSVSPSTSQAPAKPGIKLAHQLTDQAGVLGPVEYDTVNRAVTRLYDTRGTRLWVVYVRNFDGQKPFKWAEEAMRANNFTDNDAILAIATEEPAYSFRVPNALTAGTAIDLEVIRRDRISPAVFRHEWTRAALEAANSLDVAPR